jgi:hypothetical protein
MHWFRTRPLLLGASIVLPTQKLHDRGYHRHVPSRMLHGIPNRFSCSFTLLRSAQKD